MDLSVVIPVYNVEGYLSRCLDSIFNQNFKGNFEVIAVDDGSTDNSLEILKKYQEKYPNLTVVEQGTNKSLAVARSTGMKHATGDYVLHIDSDDWIKSEMFSNLLKKAAEYKNPDVIVFDYERHNGMNTLNSIKNIADQKFYENEDKISAQRLFMGTCCSKMVKNSLLKDLIYGNNYMNTTEDLIYSFEVFLRAKNILLLPEIYYCYFSNAQSLTSKVTPLKYVHSQILVYNLLNRVKNKYEPLSGFLNNVITYLDNFLVLEFFKRHLSYPKSDNLPVEFLKEYMSFSGEEKKDFINKNYYNSIYSFREMISRFGFLTTLKIIIKMKILN
jgi:glycosyltransferase involved in cell wall biosynthesis